MKGSNKRKTATQEFLDPLFWATYYIQISIYSDSTKFAKLLILHLTHVKRLLIIGCNYISTHNIGHDLQNYLVLSGTFKDCITSVAMFSG
jgi:hypothetical protein